MDETENPPAVGWLGGHVERDGVAGSGEHARGFASEIPPPAPRGVGHVVWSQVVHEVHLTTRGTSTHRTAPHRTAPHVLKS